MKRKNTLFPLPLAAILTLFLLICCNESGASKQAAAEAATDSESELVQDSKGLSRAVFASGCFWCTEAVFERVQGVERVVSGYAGGTTPKPTYEKVSAGRTDYAEAVLVYYDSTQVSYETLLDVFFHSHDPTQLNRQGPDVGRQYRSAILYNGPYQKELAQAYMQELSERKEFTKPIVTEIVPLTKFWRAEAYHQDYYRLNPDNPYIRSVSAPKVEKFEKEYRQYLKKEYQ